MSQEEAARARLIAHYEQKARETQERAERIRRSMTDLPDEAERVRARIQLGRLSAIVEENKAKAERLRPFEPGTPGP